MKPIIYFLAIMMMVTPLPTGYLFSQDMAVDLTPAEQEIRSDSEAIFRALEYTGFGDFQGFTRSLVAPELTTINDDKTPFLHDRINGRPIWRVPFMNISINSRTFDSTGKGSDLRRFDVYLDPETGQLLKIISKYEGVDTNIAPEPPAEMAEMQLRNRGELYIDFPPEPTPINFMEALNPCNDTSKEISASLIIFSIKPLYETPRAVWAITRRGIGPWHFHPPRIPNAPRVSLPLYMRNHSRSVIDATTGACLFSTTATVEFRE